MIAYYSIRTKGIIGTDYGRMEITMIAEMVFGCQLEFSETCGRTKHLSLSFCFKWQRIYQQTKHANGEEKAKAASTRM